MGHIGYIEPFEETTSDWRSCEERLKAYLSVNDVPVAKKVPAFLSLIGAKTYALLKSLTAPDAPSLREFDSLLKLLSDHLAPQSSVIAERAKFYKRSQRSVPKFKKYPDCTLPRRYFSALKRTLKEARVLLFASNEQIGRR
ncbi:hypothetical protein V5799_029236 [Amblyomma americanum]|uniref:Uncharacterized protein n=1 Tax=Amblyomma americanum TaxID=6943 RepID=A0AAQ4ERR1_AMBAM